MRLDKRSFINELLMDVLPFTEMRFFSLIIVLTMMEALVPETPFTSVVLDYLVQEQNAVREMQEMDQ